MTNEHIAPVLFYFDKAETLREFEAFRVEASQITRPHQIPAQVEVWNVIGKRRFIDRQEVIAEFPNELYAQIFADMADKTAAHI